MIDSCFSGGAELLVGQKKRHQVELPTEDGAKKCEMNGWLTWLLRNGTFDCFVVSGTIKDLLVWIKDNLLQQRPELFLQDDTM